MSWTLIFPSITCDHYLEPVSHRRSNYFFHVKPAQTSNQVWIIRWNLVRYSYRPNQDRKTTWTKTRTEDWTKTKDSLAQEGRRCTKGGVETQVRHGGNYGRVWGPPMKNMRGGRLIFIMHFEKKVKMSRNMLKCREKSQTIMLRIKSTFRDCNNQRTWDNTSTKCHAGSYRWTGETKPQISTFFSQHCYLTFCSGLSIWTFFLKLQDEKKINLLSFFPHGWP